MSDIKNQGGRSGEAENRQDRPNEDVQQQDKRHAPGSDPGDQSQQRRNPGNEADDQERERKRA